MSKTNRLIVLQIALIFASLIIQLVKEQFFSKFLFWTLFLGIVLVTYKIVNKEKHVNKALALIALDIFIYSIFAFNFPLFYQIDRDTSFEIQTTEIFLEKQMWDPTVGTGYAQNYYGYNPVLHFVMGFLSLLTGFKVAFLAKYIFLILMRLIILTSILILLKNVFHKNHHKFVYLAAYFYIITPRLRILTVSRRIMAAFFLILCVYVLLKELKDNRLLWKYLFVIFSFILAISDHSISQLFLLFLVLGAAFFYVARLFKMKVNDRTRVIFLEDTLIYSYVYICSEILMGNRLLISNWSYVRKIGSYLVELLLPQLGGISYNLPNVYSQTQLNLIYLSQILTFIVAFIGFLILFVKYINNTLTFFKDMSFAIYFILSGILGYIISLMLVLTDWNVFTNVFIWFPLISISILIAVFAQYFNKGYRYYISIAFIMIFFAGNLLINYHPNVIYPSSQSTTVLEFKEYKNPYIYNSADWLSKSSKANSTIIGDRSIFDIYSGYFRYDQVMLDLARDIYLTNQTEYEKRFLDWKVWVGSYGDVLRRGDLNYVVLNNDILELPSMLLGNPIERSKMEKFDLTNRTSRVYDNQKIVIYYNNRGRP